MSVEDQPTSMPACRGSEFCTSVATSADARCKKEKAQALCVRYVNEKETVFGRHADIDRCGLPRRALGDSFLNIGDDVGGGPTDIGADMPRGRLLHIGGDIGRHVL